MATNQPRRDGSRLEKDWPDIVDANGRAVDAGALLAAGNQWKEAMAWLITELRQED